MAVFFLLFRNAVAALPQTLTEEEFVDYVGGIINYYGGLFSWTHDSPWIKHITGQSTNCAAIIEVTINPIYFLCEVIVLYRV